jgi:Ca-activated chloride channel family protein
MIGSFHFIRPWWLIALLPAGLLWWLTRRRADATEPWRGIIAPHLLPHLMSRTEKRSRVGALELIGAGWLLSTLAIAGPTWQREPAPFANETTTLAIVIKVSPSMKTQDVQPDRLARATEKIHDLLGKRAGGKTSLIAYAGSAHLVMPATTDGGIIDTFAQALDPKIMPQDGDVAAEALRLADQTLKDSGAGLILWITDSIAPEQAGPLAEWRKGSSTPVRLLAPLLVGEELNAVTHASRAVQATQVQITADDSDMRALAQSAKFSTGSGANSTSQWKESGYWLTPAVAALMLPFFRRGWMVATAAKG